MANLNLRTSATASINKLMEECDNGEVAAMEVAMQRVTLGNLETHFNRFTDSHLELVGAAKDNDEVVVHTTLFETIEEKYSKVKATLEASIEAAAIQAQLNAQTDGSISGHQSTHSRRNHVNDIRLEKIVIPEFSGEFNKWIGFCDMFEAMVHTQEGLSTAAKYTRLMKALKGSAAQVVAGFLPTDDNYESAWKTLKARYNNDRLIVSSHLNIFWEWSHWTRRATQAYVG